MTILEPVTPFRQLRAARIAPPKIASVESIATAASYIQSSLPKWQGEEGPRWQLTIAGGSMKLGRVDLNRREKSAEAAREREMRDRAYNVGMTVAPPRGAKRSTIAGWSQQSKARMSYTLGCLDFSPLFENGGIPALVTLTMPGKGWEKITPTPKSFKVLLNRLRDRYEYAWGHTMTGVWKLEFQRRGAPHLHILMTPPHNRRAGTGETFSSWLAVNWAQLCQDPDIDWDDPEQRRVRTEHELMGTHIDYTKGLQSADTETVAAYFSKHGLFGAKDYQNEQPAIWREAAEKDGGVRFWGYWALKKAVGVIGLNPITPHYVKRHDERVRPEGPTGVQATNRERRELAASMTKEQRRAMMREPRATPKTEDQLVRDLLRAKAKQRRYQRPVKVYRNKIDYRTGEVTTRVRRARRWVRWMNAQAGFVNVRDGEAFAYEIARLLEWHRANTVARPTANTRWDSRGRVGSPRRVTFATTAG